MDRTLDRQPDLMFLTVFLYTFCILTGPLQLVKLLWSPCLRASYSVSFEVKGKQNIIKKFITYSTVDITDSLNLTLRNKT